jgi:lipopolysaccharide transport system permease protein
MPQDRSIIRIHPGDPSLLTTVREVFESHELLWVLILRQIRIRYAQTAFGAFWVVLQPLLAATLYTLVFGMFVKVPTGGVPYSLFSYAGMVSWSIFSQGFERAGVSLVQDERLITKTYFPRHLLPLSAALSVFPDLLISTLLLLPVATVMGIPPRLDIWMIVPAILPPFFLSIGAGALVASINIRWRDLRQAAPFIVQMLVWATPVAYPLELAPAAWKNVLLLNPMSAPILLFRHGLLGTPLPPLWAFLASLGFSLAVLLFGFHVFRRVEKTFADYI